MTEIYQQKQLISLMPLLADDMYQILNEPREEPRWYDISFKKTRNITNSKYNTCLKHHLLNSTSLNTPILFRFALHQLTEYNHLVQTQSQEQVCTLWSSLAPVWPLNSIQWTPHRWKRQTNVYRERKKKHYSMTSPFLNNVHVSEEYRLVNVESLNYPFTL